MVIYCAMYGCLSTAKDKERSFFRFPKDERRCKLWVVASGRPDLINKTVQNLNVSYYSCDLHFKTTDRLAKKLKRDAVPTQNLPQGFLLDRTKYTQTECCISQRMSTIENASQTSIPSVSDCSTQITTDLSADTPLKKKLLTEYKTECKRRKILESQQEYAAAYQEECDISPQLKKLIELQKQLKPNCRSNKYDKSYKLFALNIYFASPLAYRVLAKALRLPSERTLRRIKIDTGTKLDSDVFNCLESKLKNLTESEKYCIICADEISLKRNLYYQINKHKIVGFHEIDGIQTAEPATQAYVIMARGIFSNWKQLLGYCFLAKSKNYEELKTWLNDLISKIINIGFHVVAFVSDQGSNLLKLANECNVSVDKPYFHVGENKIYNIFDVPHLIKSVRNNLMKYDFEFLDNDGNKLTAKWEDIRIFYRQDCERAYRLAPKLSESHINPNNFEKMKVKYATQIFSSTVAAAMSFSIESNRLNKTASGTVKLIELMDKTFDVLNSSVVNDPNKYKTAFAAKPHQTEILDQFDHFLSNVTVLNVDKKNVTYLVECLKGLKLTLNSIKSLAKDLQSDGFGFLFTRRLNLDALENFFGSQQGGNCREPTPVQFSRAFNKLYMMNMLKRSDCANCSDDVDHLLMNTYKTGINIQSESENLQNEQATTSLLPVAVGTTDYRFDLPENNAFLYVCGYLLKKCVDIHKCEGIVQYVGFDSQISDDNFFIKSKSFNQKTLRLIIPPKSFVACIQAMNVRFKLIFVNKILDSVGNHILKELADISVTDCCECFPNIYLKKLFVRFRIYNVIRFNNLLFRDKSLKRNYFSVDNL